MLKSWTGSCAYARSCRQAMQPHHAQVLDRLMCICKIMPPSNAVFLSCGRFTPRSAFLGALKPRSCRRKQYLLCTGIGDLAWTAIENRARKATSYCIWQAQPTITNALLLFREWSVRVSQTTINVNTRSLLLFFRICPPFSNKAMSNTGSQLACSL